MLSSILALTLAATSPAAAATPIDLLAFDEGTLLASAPPSYGEGLAEWAPYHLTDGDDAAGWCSAEGQPAGATFVYELARAAAPRSLRLSTAGAQEDGYPGISAKAVELFVAGPSKAFTSAGTFEVPKGGQKEFPISAPAPVKWVKLVVKSNWGHPQFTELMEAELRGAWTEPPPTFDASGDYWSTSWNGLRLQQTGSHVEGCYDFRGGTFSGDIEGRVARVTWHELDESGQALRGKATFVVSADRKAIRGVYFDDQGSLQGAWDMTAATAGQVAKCRPVRTTVADQLAREGRLALYGIHFDTNSDVPRPDSEPTLRSLADALRAKPGLELRVEGHTDATNTDAYNLDLSERRARAVVQWLSSHGVDAGRLTAKGFGRTRPVASNATSQGRALNRRVEVALPGK